MGLHNYVFIELPKEIRCFYSFAKAQITEWMPVRFWSLSGWARFFSDVLEGSSRAASGSTLSLVYKTKTNIHHLNRHEDLLIPDVHLVFLADRNGSMFQQMYMIGSQVMRIRNAADK